MKKLVSLIILFLLSLNFLQAKNKFFGWFHITPKIGFGSSLLVNNKMFDFNQVTPGIFNGSYMFGGQLGVAFVDMYDLSFEINKNITNQFYSINTDNLDYDKKLKFTNLDYGVFFKIMANTGYFEIGTTVSNLNDILIINTVSSDQSLDPDFQDNTDYFEAQHFNLVAGLGTTFAQVDLFEFTLGLRVNYGIQPLATGPELPLLDNVYSGTLSNDAKSRNLSFTVDITIHHFFGFFGKAICGQRSVIFFQKPAKLW